MAHPFQTRTSKCYATPEACINPVLAIMTHGVCWFVQCLVPQRVDGSPEVLQWEHHGRTGVDRQRHSIVQVHVVQPVVIDLPAGGQSGSYDSTASSWNLFSPSKISTLF